MQRYLLTVGLSIFLISCLTVFAFLWEQTGPSQFRKDELLWYLAFNEWILIATPYIHFEIQDEFYNGTFTGLLLKPISYIGAKIASGLGHLLFNLPILALVSFGFAFLWTGSFPFTLASFCGALILGFLASLLALFAVIGIGLLSFWVADTFSIFWFWQHCVFLCGGLILPLLAYPPLVQKLVTFTPFFYILGGRSQLVFQQDLWYFFWIAGSLCVWMAIILFGIKKLFQNGLRRWNAHGG